MNRKIIYIGIYGDGAFAMAGQNHATDDAVWIKFDRNNEGGKTLWLTKREMEVLSAEIVGYSNG